MIKREITTTGFGLMAHPYSGVIGSVMNPTKIKSVGLLCMVIILILSVGMTYLLQLIIPRVPVILHQVFLVILTLGNHKQLLYESRNLGRISTVGPRFTGMLGGKVFAR